MLYSVITIMKVALETGPAISHVARRGILPDLVADKGII